MEPGAAEGGHPEETPAGDAPPADDFANNVINSVFDLWVMPELARRNMTLGRDEVCKVVVELDPDRKYPRVWLNDEAKIVVKAVATRAIEAGEEVTEADIDEIHAVLPNDVGPNSGYVCFVTIRGQSYVHFDFRYNKERVAGLLTRARQFLTVARNSVDAAPAVACDVAFSSAELSIQAQMLLQQEKTRSHSQRQAWIDQWVAHNNAPQDHAAVLRQLHEYRSSGRYADGGFNVAPEKVAELLAVVDDMIVLAEEKSS